MLGLDQQHAVDDVAGHDGGVAQDRPVEARSWTRHANLFPLKVRRIVYDASSIVEVGALWEVTALTNSPGRPVNWCAAPESTLPPS